MSLRRHSSRSRSRRGRRRSRSRRRSPSDRRERSSSRRRRRSRTRSRRRDSPRRDHADLDKDSSSGKTRRRRKSQQSKASAPEEDEESSDEAMSNMNSEEEGEWLEKRRLRRLEIQKKHETAQMVMQSPTTSAPSSGERCIRPKFSRTVAPGTPAYLEPPINEGSDVTDIFGPFVSSPAPESPLPGGTPDHMPSSNAGNLKGDEPLEKIDVDDVLNKLGANDSESEDEKSPDRMPEKSPQVVGGINVTELRKNLDKERAKLREFIRKTKNDHEEAEEQGEDAAQHFIADFHPDLREDWDDKEGYYKPRIGELIDGRFRVFAECAGKGVFSNVLRATEVSTGDEVAIKIIRSNDMMKKAAEKEVEILRILNEADAENRRHVVRLLDVFTYRNHYCLVFELMGYNLRQALKNYGKGRGLTLSAVHAYAWQLFIALRLIKKCGFVHADIKPDNMLIGTNNGKDLKKLKICDLGSALDAKTECDITSYLVSRFYRAPEIILGQKYDYAVDIWAVGCTLYELVTGKILFKGVTNNDMLKQIINVCGATGKMMKRGAFQKKHFTSDGHFQWEDRDKFSKRSVIRTIKDLRSRVDIEKELLKRCRPEHKAKAKQLADLIRKTLILDPKKRITTNEAFDHPFIKDPVPEVRS
eukprot:GEMP01006335.1.p1 GENE.GEMP01006335.1~~GEMP01006335.1.p1  ORF type:complete len:651 (+),score=114.99 GEMP01006335.1:24-1955(+)